MRTDLAEYPPRGGGAGGPAVALGAMGLAWVAGVVALAAGGAFDVPASEPALPTLIAILAPVAGFAAVIALSPRARAFVLRVDPVLLVELQAWRILGGLFLAVYAFGHLPALFALPAGIGDVAVGIAAPFVAWRLRRDPAFLATGRYRLFHALGLLDFIVAVSAGIVARNAIPGLVEGVTSTAMDRFPLVLIPTVAVPAFIILHLVALMQSAAAAHPAPTHRAATHGAPTHRAAGPRARQGS